MELFLFQHDEWERLYNNCSQIDIRPKPWPERLFIPESLLLMVLSGIYYVLYIPCLYSFAKNWRDEKGCPNPCYQIMFYISVLDMGALWIISFYSGFQFMAGNVYCTHPILNYFLGELSLSIITSEAVADVILAVDRCLDIIVPSWSVKLFRGKRLWFFWLTPATLYGLYYFVMSSPIVYNGATIVFTDNPYVGYWDDNGEIFKNSMQLNIHQYTLFFGTPTIYALFFIGLVVKTSQIKTESLRITKLQKNAFYQVFIISLFNMVAGGLYHVNAHFPGLVSPPMIFLAHFAWVHIHGIPPVIYLLFNKTIRKDVRLLFKSLLRADRVRAIGQTNSAVVVTQIKRSNTNTLTHTHPPTR